MLLRAFASRATMLRGRVRGVDGPLSHLRRRLPCRLRFDLVAQAAPDSDCCSCERLEGVGVVAGIRRSNAVSGRSVAVARLVVGSASLRLSRSWWSERRWRTSGGLSASLRSDLPGMSQTPASVPNGPGRLTPQWSWASPTRPTRHGRIEVDQAPTRVGLPSPRRPSHDAPGSRPACRCARAPGARRSHAGNALRSRRSNAATVRRRSHVGLSGAQR